MMLPREPSVLTCQCRRATYFRSPLPPSKSLNPSQPNAIEFDGDDFSAVWVFDSLSDMTQLRHRGKMSPARRAFPDG